MPVTGVTDINVVQTREHLDAVRSRAAEEQCTRRIAREMRSHFRERPRASGYCRQ
jgi:hypothetical protein